MNRRDNWWIVIGLLLGCAFIGYQLFIDRAAKRTYQAYVALDGREPWGPLYPPSDPPDTVILYRSVRSGIICFDAFRSKELHDRLSSRNGQSVTVEYDTFSDFGKVRGYNVHSVDGIVLANGYHVLRDDFASTAGVVGNTDSKDDPCW